MNTEPEPRKSQQDFHQADLLDAALKYHEHSIQVFPTPWGSKVPAAPWKKYTERPNSEEFIRDTFTSRHNIAAVCGTISQNLFTIDFDSMAAFNAHRRKIERLLNSTPVYRTGRGVGVLARSTEPIRTRNHIVEKVDIRGEGAYVIVPPSMHPSGRQYEFWSQWNAIAIIEPGTLPFDLEKPRPAAAVKMDGAYNGPPTVRPYGLPVRLWELLRGAPIGTRYASRSEAEQAITLWCVNNGWQGLEILGLFYMHAGPGTKFKTEKAHNAETARKYIEGQIAAAAAYLQEHRSQVDREIDRFWELIEVHPWNPRTRHTDKAVAAAILTKARMCGRVRGIGASRREIAELAGISWITAHRGIYRISPVILAEPSGSFALNTSLIQYYKDPTVKKCIKDARGLNSPAVRDVFHGDGLGKTGRAIYEALKEPLTFTALLGVVKMDPRTVKRRLKALMVYGLAFADGPAFQAVPDVNMEAVAVELKTSGRTEAQKERHRKDRAAFAAWKEEQAKRRRGDDRAR